MQLGWRCSKDISVCLNQLRFEKNESCGKCSDSIRNRFLVKELPLYMLTPCRAWKHADYDRFCITSTNRQQKCYEIENNCYITCSALLAAWLKQKVHLDWDRGWRLFQLTDLNTETKWFKAIEMVFPLSWRLCSNCWAEWYSRRLLLPLTGIENGRRQPAFGALRASQISLLSAFEIWHSAASADYRMPAITGDARDSHWAEQNQVGVDMRMSGVKRKLTSLVNTSLKICL